MEEKDLIKIEAKLLEQEHRPFTLLKNFFNRKKWGKEDPRRKAVKMALLWRLFFSPAVVAGTGGLIALASLFILHWQTEVLVNQNELLIKQNEKIDNQTYLIEAQRRSALQFEISEILNRIDDELGREGNTERKLSAQLKSRIIAATVSMKPYRSYENDSLSEPYSYEKGQFFVALLNSSVAPKDIDEILKGGNFSDMYLKNVTLNWANFGKYTLGLEFKDSKFEDVTFIGLNGGSLLIFNNIKFNSCVFKDWKSEYIIFKNSILFKTSISFCNEKKINKKTPDNRGSFKILMDNSHMKLGFLEHFDRSIRSKLSIIFTGGNNSMNYNIIEDFDVKVYNRYKEGAKTNLDFLLLSHKSNTWIEDFDFEINLEGATNVLMSPNMFLNNDNPSNLPLTYEISVSDLKRSLTNAKEEGKQFLGERIFTRQKREYKVYSATKKFE